MSDRGHDRHGTAGNRPCHRLLVEGHEILGRSAAAPDDDDLDAGYAGDGADGVGDLGGGAFALHPRRPDDEVGVGMAAGEDLDDVAERRTIERRDDPDLGRQRRQRPFASRVEEAFGLELLLQLLERQLQRAEALGLEVVAEDLVLALGLVDADAGRGRSPAGRLQP